MMNPSPKRWRSLTRDARTAIDTVVNRNAWLYDRARDLPLLLPEVCWQDATPTPDAVRIALEKALARERRLGCKRHRGYSLSRHIALAAAFKAETSAAGQPLP